MQHICMYPYHTVHLLTREEMHIHCSSIFVTPPSLVVYYIQCHYNVV